MAHKTYTINVDGNSEGNVIASPFTINVEELQYLHDNLVLITSTDTGNGTPCTNSDIAGRIEYDSPAMSSSKNADLTSTIEVDLDNVYGQGNWS